MAEEFKPKPLQPGESYLVVIKEQAFFKNEYGSYTPAKEKVRIEIRKKKTPAAEVPKETL